MRELLRRRGNNKSIGVSYIIYDIVVNDIDGARAIPFDPKLVAASEHHHGVRFKSSMVKNLRFDNALHK